MHSSTPTDSQRPVTIAIFALGGQGGGVLAEWIVDVAESFGWLVQSTSVPGVAQRTGTTVYYVETCPSPKGGGTPIFALMPVPGDVDIVIAAELMEAGRAVARGFVSPGRTTTIASTHRIYGITEKSAMGDGIADGNAVTAALKSESRKLLSFDIDAVCTETGCVISSVLFGALAASGALPFPRTLYEEAVRKGGVSVAMSLQGFELGFDRARLTAPSVMTVTPGSVATSDTGRAMAQRVKNEFPAHLYDLIVEGVRRLFDYQDSAYVALYLNRLNQIHSWETEASGVRSDFSVTATAARYLALWMSFEDSIRVADLKTRRQRFERFRGEVQAAPDQLVYVTEYMHPRYQEFCETLPARVGRWFQSSPLSARLLAPLFRRGRHINAAKLSGFLPLYLLATLRRWRRGTLRYQLEQQRIEAWLTRLRTIMSDRDLALELAECPRLIKGYGETHERGLERYESIMQLLDRRAIAEDFPMKIRRLRSAALADEDGKAFAATLHELGVIAS